MVKPLTEQQPEVCGIRILSLAGVIITQLSLPDSGKQQGNQQKLKEAHAKEKPARQRAIS